MISDDHNICQQRWKEMQKVKKIIIAFNKYIVIIICCQVSFLFRLLLRDPIFYIYVQHTHTHTHDHNDNNNNDDDDNYYSHNHYYHRSMILFNVFLFFHRIYFLFFFDYYYGVITISIVYENGWFHFRLVCLLYLEK